MKLLFHNSTTLHFLIVEQFTPSLKNLISYESVIRGEKIEDCYASLGDEQ